MSLKSASRARPTRKLRRAGGGIKRTVKLTCAASEDELLFVCSAASRLDAARRYDDAGGEVRLRTGARDRVVHAARDSASRRRRPGKDCAHAAGRAYSSAGVCRSPSRIRPIHHGTNSFLKWPMRAWRAIAMHSATIMRLPWRKRAPFLPLRKSMGSALRLHAEQFRPGTGAALAAELDAATADHLETVTDETLRRIARRRCPARSSSGLGLRAQPHAVSAARKMVDMGLAIVLATDFNPGSSPVAIHAVHDVAGLRADGPDAGGSPDGKHDQRGIQPRPRQQSSAPSNPASRPIF